MQKISVPREWYKLFWGGYRGNEVLIAAPHKIYPQLLFRDVVNSVNKQFSH
jgi:hypothetical protein